MTSDEQEGRLRERRARKLGQERIGSLVEHDTLPSGLEPHERFTVRSKHMRREQLETRDRTETLVEVAYSLDTHKRAWLEQRDRIIVTNGMNRSEGVRGAAVVLFGILVNEDGSLEHDFVVIAKVDAYRNAHDKASRA